MYNIIVTKFSASDKYSDTKRHKNHSKFKEHEDNSKKHRKKIKVTPLGSATSSRKVLKIKTILNMEKRITRISSKNGISCRQKLPNKGPSIKI